MGSALGRRDFIKLAGAGAVIGAVGSRAALGSEGSDRVATRRWLGPRYWANRLQDWQWRDGKIECIGAKGNRRLRVATLLTEQVVDRAGGFSAACDLSFASPPGGGFAGILLGIGSGQLDWVAQGNVFGVGGKGGGVGCVAAPDGRVLILDNTEENRRRPRALATSAPARERALSSTRCRLETHIERIGVGIRLSAILADEDGSTISSVATEGLDPSMVLGGLGLLCDGGDAANQPISALFGELEVRGSMVRHYPERAFGPVAGIQYTIGAHGLRLTAQFIPTGRTADDDQLDIPEARLDFRPVQNDGEWLAGPTTRLTIPAHIAPFRLPEWDRSRAWSVRVVPLLRDGREAPSEYHYLGHIPAEQAAARPSRVLLFHCPRMVGVSNDQDYAARPAEQAFERFTSRNLIMPATASQRRMEDELQPDLLVFTGDQMYEQIPTLPDVDDAGSPRADDYLYRWLLFLRTFGHLTRRVPTVTIPDDHDLYLGNIWGWSGREPRGARGEPGYNHERGWAFSVGFYNLVIDTQTSHLPPPADPTPMPRGLKKYYTRLDYGGISYAIIEGRTYKTPPYPEFVDNPDSASLLGESQLAFVKSWGASLPSDTPRIAISQTVFANPMTNADGSLSKNEYDANAWPAPGRDRAVEAFKEAGALLVGGDIHNAVFLKHGVDSDEDGPYQFIPCAFGQFFQRWWEPREEGRDRRPTDPPFTGLHRDGEGHRFRMIACTNARISFAEAQRAGFIIGRFIIDPNLTRSGYGLLEIDPSASTVVIEHWDREADAAGRPAQFEGWPVVLPIPKPKYDGLERHQGVGRGSQTTP